MMKLTLVAIVASILLIHSEAHTIIRKASHPAACSKGDEFHAPCLCTTTVSGMTLVKDKKMTLVQFPEITCMEEENKKRLRKDRRNAGKYFCYQVEQKVTILRDIFDEPVNVNVSQKTGCELRCVHKHCK